MLGNVTLVAVLITYVSAISSATTEAMAVEFGQSLEVVQLSTAIFLFGVSPAVIFGHTNSGLNFSDQFAFGALPVAPLSESFGRQPIYLVTLLVSSAFTIGTGAAQTWAQVLVCRFFAGATGGKRGFSYHAIDLMADRFTRDDEKSRCSGCCWRIAE